MEAKARAKSEQRGSSDPNDIIGPAGFGAEGFITPEQNLPYKIRFENMASATAPAQVVRITHQLDPDLDLRTFQLGEFGFGNLRVEVPEGRTFFSTRLDLRQTHGVFVDVAANVDVASGLATWTFTAVDPATLDLPADVLSGFLPPNRTSPEGEGFVSYSVRPQTTLGTGARLDALARIVFAGNEPIDTPAIFNTIDAGPPTSNVAALPSKENISFTVSWNGADEPGGSGIATYDVFVSDNGGAFTLLADDTTATSQDFTGEPGHTYQFFSVATDNVGHVESVPAVPDAETTITLDSRRNILVAGADAGASPRVRVFDTETNTEMFSFLAYESKFTGGVRVAVGDLNGDKIPDIVTAPGAGHTPEIKVFDGATGMGLSGALGQFLAYAATSTGGVFVAVGDVNNDGFDDIITGAGPGRGGSQVRVFSGETGAPIFSFFPFGPRFRGGVRVAAGDVNGDGFDDVIAGAGPGRGGPQVRVFSGASGLQRTSFFAYETRFRRGIFVAAGDIDGDGRADIITGRDRGATPQVRAFDGTTVVSDFLAYDSSFRGGVRVAVGDINGDGRADIISTPGSNALLHARAFDALTGDEIDSLLLDSLSARVRPGSIAWAMETGH